MDRIKLIWEVIRKTLIDFFKELPLIHGASLAYYAILALVPLIYLSITVFGQFVGNENMQMIIEHLLKDQIGITDISGIMDFIKNVDFSVGDSSLQILGIVMVLFSSTAILSSLRKSINRFYGIDNVAVPTHKVIIRTLLFKLLSMAMIVATTVLIIVLYFAETVILSLEADYLSKYDYLSWAVNGVVLHGVPLLTNLIIFTFIFKYVHDGVVRWGIAIRGAAWTAFCLYLGQLLIKYYLMNYFFASGSGIAGTFLVVLVWVYYSSFILLLGVKFTAEYANRIGEPIKHK